MKRLITSLLIRILLLLPLLAQPSLERISNSQTITILQASAAPADSQIMALLSLSQIPEEGYDTTNQALLRQAIQLIKKSGRRQWLGVVAHLQGDIYMYTNQYEEAVQAFWEAIAIDQNRPSLMADHYMALGEAYDFLGEKNYIEWDSSLVYFQQSRDILTQTKDSLDLAHLYVHYVDYYLREENLEAVDRYTDSLVDIAKHINNQALLIQAYESKIQVSMTLDREEDTDQTMDEIYQLQNLLVDQKYVSNKRKASLQMFAYLDASLNRFEAEEAEKELAQQAAVAKRNLIIAVLAGLGLLVLALFAFSLYRSRQQQKKLTDQVIQQRDRNELLLRELNHRVKNNLQQISGLLMLQGRQAPHQETREALKVSQQRMETMSLLHTMLYQGEDVGEINLRDYLHTLTHNLLTAYGYPADQLDLRLSLADLSVDVDQGIALGLIANEWITNALKYAIPHTPFLDLSLQLIDPKTAELTIADHGPGLLPGFDPMTASSYGLQLVQTMSEQMYGEVKVDSKEGTEWKIRFELGLTEELRS